ncbi:hypothetical protein D9615_008929 [Tricholomella constricta]|uniref:TEA domain-containing protein n=1 Tax=Tricholomella constricta TaxID=117010 RepID=A0A8H5H0Z5_9AGAR|nr:hypothetical protein D9615_008929 [Tricholomella constricta]
MASEGILASLRSSPSSNRVCTSIPNNFKFPPLQSTRTQDVFQSIVKGRKSWKTLRGGEIVWPPELEAALLEGLEAYQPDDSRETRLLGRFPMRNRFISDYIFHRTGTRRTAKQVGSRLQQLRDTCGGKKLMKLLSPCRPVGPSRCNDFSYRSSNNCDTDSSSDASSSPSTPVDASTNLRRLDGTTPPSRTVISIDILPNGISPYEPSTRFSSEVSEWDRANGVVRPSLHPRPFRTIDPTVTFVAPSAISAHSNFTVYSAGLVVYSETTQLNSAGRAPERTDGALLYSTILIPGFWQKIADSPDPTQYTIIQDVIQGGQDVPSIVFSAMYKFNYPSGARDNFTSPAMEGFDDEKVLRNVQASLPMDCLLAMDTYPDLMEAEAYYDFAAINNTRPAWDARSPSELSTELSGYTNSEDELDPILSPVSACFSTDLSHYASPLQSSIMWCTTLTVSLQVL